MDLRAALRQNLLVAAAWACAAACVPRPLFQSPSRAVTGELMVETSSSEPKTYRPSACLSGDHFYFLGVDLEDRAAHAVLRVVVDPLDGPILRLTSSAGVLRLDRNSCSSFRVSIDPTGWRVNHVRDFSGSLDLDCVTANAARVSGRLAFQHCH